MCRVAVFQVGHKPIEKILQLTDGPLRFVRGMQNTAKRRLDTGERQFRGRTSCDLPTYGGGIPFVVRDKRSGKRADFHGRSASAAL